MRRPSALLAAAAAALAAIADGTTVAHAQEVVHGPSPPEVRPGRTLHAGMPSWEYRFRQTGIRFAHMRPCGKHSFFVSDPSNALNADEYLTSLVGYRFRTGGRQILDDRCHADSSCALPPKAW
ncbi:MAG: hypothetical protein FJ087_20350 [Deltaproteobacteria bacterium]|nr:hypothetical protein [Deltaproteobacteria bacterium]